MSDEVKTEDTEPTPEILPAKSADKLEIEREEQEAKEELEAKEKAEEKGKEIGEGDADAKDEEVGQDKGGDEAGDKKEDEDTEGNTGKEKKKFKLPNVHIKAPKVPEFLRNMQKDKKKDKSAEGGEEVKKDEEGAEDEIPKEDEAADPEAEPSAVKNAKTRVIEAIEGIHLPKISKPAFLKKKKQQSTDEAEEAKEEEGEAKEEKDNEANKAEEEKQEGAEAEGEKQEQEEDQTKKSGILDNLKNIKSQVFGPKKSKDVTDGDKEESKELLDKKDKEGDGDDVEKGAEEDKDKEDGDGKNDAASKGSSLLESLRNVASQVFKKPKEKEVDIEAGEKDELLDKEGKETDSNKKVEGDDLEDVKVDKKEGDNISHCSEKKDPEKSDEDKADQGFCKHLARVKTAKDECVLQFNQLDQQKKYSLIGIVSGVILLLLIIIICLATISSSSKNQSKLVDNGKFVETHSSCGKVQGIVDGTDMFSFIGIPYAVPLNGTQRWTHSRPIASLEDCHEGTLLAHSKNLTAGARRCWRKYPSGNSAGIENCLTLDIFTPSVMYDELLPVVVYIDGDDLSEEDSEKLRPSSALAKNQSMVFVNLNYRRGVLGFLSLDTLSKRQYPATSGNYGLGDIISALQWIKLNINHFGGHPSKVTILGRGSGGTWATALTASKKARGLFKKVWVSNGAGTFQPNSLESANIENEQNVVKSLNCRTMDVVDCLLDTAPEELLKVIPTDWEDWRKVDLPRKGEAKHSWLVVDKDVFLENPQTYWKANYKNNDIKMVFGATSQGAVSQLNKAIMDWNNLDSYSKHVEDNLGSFNATIASQAIDNYKGQEPRDHWQEYSSMVTDIRTVCPQQHLATEMSSSSSNVYSYVVTQKSSQTQDAISDKAIDIAAIFGVFEANNQAEVDYMANMQSMFYTFVREGQLPHGNRLQNVGMYIINDKIETQKAYPKCDFWQSISDIVPNYGKVN